MAGKPLSAAAIAGILAGTAWLSAQDPPKVFKSATELAYVTATVTERNGRPAPKLPQESFAVYEDDVRQDIAFFGLDDETPLSVALVVDTSGSMADKMDDVRDALEHFVRDLRTDDEVTLLRFSNDVDVVATGTGADNGQLRRAIKDLRARGGTALYDAIDAGVRRARGGRHRKKVVIVVSDGNDTSSDRRRDDAEGAVRQSEVLLYALGIGHGERGSFGHGSLGRGDEVDGEMLKALAEPSGGRAWVLEGAHRRGVDLVDEAVKEITAELRRQYTLGYYPQIPTTGSTFRKLRVTVSGEQYRVRARSGLFTGPPGKGVDRQP